MRKLLPFLFIIIIPFFLNAQCEDNGNVWNQSWVSCTNSSNPNPDRGDSRWILYAFDEPHAIDSSYFWNANRAGESGWGAKEVAIDYSVDGNSWTELGQFNFPQASESNDYEGFEGPEFNSVIVEKILITVLSTHDGGNCASLAEIQFKIDTTTCLGVVDECGICDGDGEPTWYLDADEDGLGDANVSIAACLQPLGYVDNSMDNCDDGSLGWADVFPLFENNGCTGCHGQGASGGLNLLSFNTISMGGAKCGTDLLTGTKLVDVINISGYDACGSAISFPSMNMRTGNQFDETELAQLQAWVDGGAPEFCEDYCLNYQVEIPYNGIDDDCDATTLDDDLDQDGFVLAEDCDDNNPNINPEQQEIPYNGIDDDCDSSTLDDDLDQDDFVLSEDCDDNNPNLNPDQQEIPYNGIDDDCDTATLDDDLDQDGFVLAEDCDDNNPDINLEQDEIPYNGIDDDCDTATLDDDLDQDGFVLAEDCDDNNPDINPNQQEIPYNGIDDDCDAATLDDDLDQDGFVLAEDCDDNNPNLNPEQIEIPYNGIDDDCNAATLDDDLDQDGFVLAEDCDDNNPNLNPEQQEIPYNGIDDDCDPTTLDDDLDQDGFVLEDDCDDNNPNLNPEQQEIPYNGIDDDCDPTTLDDDLDQDGFVLEEDCDDNNPNLNPEQPEIPYNGIDDDCDPTTLDDDLDQDGFVLEEDCDDNNPNLNPEQPEIPYNGIDDDCDAATLDDDLDQDGFVLAEDCNDEDATINPDAEEIPNNDIDEDCDGFDLTTSISEITNLSINIYPNPTSNIINISGVDELEYESIIFDAQGKELIRLYNQSRLNIHSFPSGFYLLQIRDIKTLEKMSFKIIKID